MYLYPRSRRIANSFYEFNPSEGMNMSGESLLVILFVGLIAGWLAGKIVRGTGFGIIGDLLVGIVASIINATVGAIVLLLVVRLVRGGSYWEGSGRRWGWSSRRY